MSATEVITCSDCGTPLRESFDRLIGVCDGCASRWFALAVIGVPSRDEARRAAHGYDPEHEIRQDCEADLLTVRCAGCGDTYRADSAPDGEWWCSLCQMSAVS